jgi:2-oxoglutarate ferredoxin oxidoreductase subunit alpha
VDALPEIGVAWRLTHGPGPYRPYGFSALEEVPPFAVLGGDRKVTVTGSAHNKDGWLRKNDAETLEVLRHLEAKIDAEASAMAMVATDVEDGADTVVLSYGVTARAAHEAVLRGRALGKRLSFVGVQTLFPVPERALREAVGDAKRVLVVEENLTGLYRSVLAGALPGVELAGLHRIGSMIRPGEIVDAL